MTLIEEIERDVQAGTQGSWGLTNADVTFSVRGGEDRGSEREPNARRIANVPRYERAIMTANELADSVDSLLEYMRGHDDGCGKTSAALKAFREVTQ